MNRMMTRTLMSEKKTVALLLCCGEFIDITHDL